MEWDGKEMVLLREFFWDFSSNEFLKCSHWKDSKEDVFLFPSNCFYPFQHLFLLVHRSKSYVLWIPLPFSPCFQKKNSLKKTTFIEKHQKNVLNRRLMVMRFDSYSAKMIFLKKLSIVDLQITKKTQSSNTFTVKFVRYSFKKRDSSPKQSPLETMKAVELLWLVISKHPFTLYDFTKITQWKKNYLK